MALTIITRSDARAQGLKRYFTGEPCKRGHIAERHVSNLTCMTCSVERTRERQWHVANPERASANRERWAEANPEKVLASRLKRSATAEAKAYQAEWYRQNRERIRAAQKERSRANSAQAVDRARAWAKENPERAREHFKAGRARRRARLLGSEGRHTRKDVAEILEAQKGCCAYCRADLHKAKRHVDHIIPLARGGSNDRRNIQILCRPCNQRKSAKDPLDFAREQGLLL